MIGREHSTLFYDPNWFRRAVEPEVVTVTVPVFPVAADAACRKLRASRAAARAILGIMRDGIERIDEDLWQVVKKPGGGKWSPSTVQHARLALQSAGILEWSGGTRKTQYGKVSCAWRMKP